MSETISNCYCRGKQISLRHPTEEDIDDGWYEWFSDEETTLNLTYQYWPNSREAQLEYYRHLLHQRDRLALSIIENAHNKLIGTCSLNKINWVHRHADIAVVLGNKDFHRGAIGVEAYNLLLKVAFTRLNLNTVLSVGTSNNEAAHQIRKIVGFESRGSIPDLVNINGKNYDGIISSVSREVWLAKNMGG